MVGWEIKDKPHQKEEIARKGDEVSKVRPTKVEKREKGRINYG